MGHFWSRHHRPRTIRQNATKSLSPFARSSSSDYRAPIDDRHCYHYRYAQQTSRRVHRCQAMMHPVSRTARACGKRLQLQQQPPPPFLFPSHSTWSSSPPDAPSSPSSDPLSISECSPAKEPSLLRLLRRCVVLFFVGDRPRLRRGCASVEAALRSLDPELMRVNMRLLPAAASTAVCVCADTPARDAAVACRRLLRTSRPVLATPTRDELLVLLLLLLLLLLLVLLLRLRGHFGHGSGGTHTRLAHSDTCALSNREFAQDSR